ncbi:hypothetical protein KLQUCP338B2_07600 [Klebsiella quasipneumoniae subsp. similipneumoniae]
MPWTLSEGELAMRLSRNFNRCEVALMISFARRPGMVSDEMGYTTRPLM